MRALALLITVAMALPSIGATHVSGDEVRWACGGGNRPEDCGIDPVDQPVFDGDEWISDGDQVLGINIDGDTRAYPTKMLDRHEIVNGVQGGIKVAVTWCPLCGSGITFDRTVDLGNGPQELTFEASGYLYKHDLVMWDRETETLWTQIRGDAIGHLDGDKKLEGHPDAKLDVIPTEVTTWAAWKRENPETLLLQPMKGFRYGGAYAGYSDDCNIGISRQSDCNVTGLHPKQFVLGVSHQGNDVAFVVGPQCKQTEGGIVPCGLLSAGGATYHAPSNVVAAAGPSGGAFAYDAGDHTFTQDEAGVWVDGEGRPWDLSTGTSRDGEQLQQIDALTLYWFAWTAHHEDTDLWVAAGDTPELRLDDGQLPGFRIGVLVLSLVALGIWWRRRHS